MRLSKRCCIISRLATTRDGSITLTGIKLAARTIAGAAANEIKPVISPRLDNMVYFPLTFDRRGLALWAAADALRVLDARIAPAAFLE